MRLLVNADQGSVEPILDAAIHKFEINRILDPAVLSRVILEHQSLVKISRDPALALLIGVRIMQRYEELFDVRSQVPPRLPKE